MTKKRYVTLMENLLKKKTKSLLRWNKLDYFYSDYIIYDALYKATNRINNKMEVKQKE